MVLVLCVISPAMKEYTSNAVLEYHSTASHDYLRIGSSTNTLPHCEHMVGVTMRKRCIECVDVQGSCRAPEMYIVCGNNRW